MRRKRDQVPFDDGVETTPDSVRGGDVSRDIRSNGDHVGAGSPRGQVHSVRPVGSLIGDRFVVRAHLGRDRSGERYEAVDRSLSDPELSSERCVVLHFLNGRVAQQTRVLQKLETSYHQPHSWAHRNIFSVLGFGSDHGEYFFVTEELEGGTLRTILDDVAPEVPSEEETFGVLSGIGDALKYAHAKGVVHGDIRPENIFVTTDLVVKVLDLLPATLPRIVPIFPEDKTAPAVPDPRDDVYGLACVAYELFAGRHPFNSNTALEALAAGLKPTPIPGLDARSWDALVRGLALRREQRTTSIATFLTGLGVTGHERLRRDGGEDRAEPMSDADDIVLREIDVPRAVAPTVRPIASRPIARPIASTWDASRLELFRIRRDEPVKRTRWLAWAAALVIGLGAAAYWNFDWLQQHGPGLVAAGRNLVDGVQSRVRKSAVAESEKPTASSEIATPPPSARTAAAEPGAAPTAAGRADAAPPPSSAPTIKRSAPESSSSIAPPNGAATVLNEAAKAPPQQANPPPTLTADANPSRAPQPSAAAGEPPAPETFEPEKPVVVVSEAAPSAAITIRRHGGTGASTTFVWWTSDGTALADEDYINFGARIEKLAAGEETRTIHIPIVHDSKREGRESFYVNVRSGQGKREDPAQRIEVIIEDDD
jgi:serine/threonine protein kinase